MNIASPRVDALVHQLARLTGEDVETALERALQERLARVAPVAARDRPDALRVFLERVAGLAVVDPRQPDEMIGYGPDGLPD